MTENAIFNSFLLYIFWRRRSPISSVLLWTKLLKQPIEAPLEWLQLLYTLTGIIAWSMPSTRTYHALEDRWDQGLPFDTWNTKTFESIVKECKRLAETDQRTLNFTHPSLRQYQGEKKMGLWPYRRLFPLKSMKTGSRHS